MLSLSDTGPDSSYPASDSTHPRAHLPSYPVSLYSTGFDVPLSVWSVLLDVPQVRVARAVCRVLSLALGKEEDFLSNLCKVWWARRVAVKAVLRPAMKVSVCAPEKGSSG